MISYLPIILRYSDICVIIIRNTVAVLILNMYAGKNVPAAHGTDPRVPSAVSKVVCERKVCSGIMQAVKEHNTPVVSNRQEPLLEMHTAYEASGFEVPFLVRDICSVLVSLLLMISIAA